MHNTGFGGFIPGGKGFTEKRLRGLGVFRGHRGFHFTRNRADGTADLQVVLGMLFRLPMRFERRCVTTCL